MAVQSFRRWHMHQYSAMQQIAAEFIGTAFLLAAVVGSGIMAEQLAGGNVAIALLANAIATGAMLYVLITALGPISGAHINPAVTMVFAISSQIGNRMAVAYVIAQITGAIAGVWIAHLMFNLPVLQVSETIRSGASQYFAECVATFGLVFTILGTLKFRKDSVAMAVGFYITAAYWFTASTSFANPAVTIARALSDTFAGIAPTNVSFFVVSQIVGAGLAGMICVWLLEPAKKQTSKARAS